MPAVKPKVEILPMPRMLDENTVKNRPKFFSNAGNLPHYFMRAVVTSDYITLQIKFVIRQIQKCPTAKYIVHLK